MRRCVGLLCSGWLFVSVALADFSHDQITRFTGGAMLGMMRMAGALSKNLREPNRSTVIVKGNRMAQIDSQRTQLIDLDAGTITSIDHAKHTYSVMTFAEMKQMMEEMAARMNGKNKSGQPMKIIVDVKETGQTREISGLKTREVHLGIKMQTSDADSGQQGTMNVVSALWLAPGIPGYQEVQAFHRRMAEKLAWTPGSNFAAMMPSGAGQAMAEAHKQMSKLDGVPVLTIMRVGAGEQAVPQMDSATRQAEQQQAQQNPPTAGDVAGSVIGSSIPGLGRFGGFGRKKKQPPQEQQPAQQPRQQSAAAPDSLMEITTESQAFSQAPVDPSKLEVPPGYKQVESDYAKRHR